MNIALIRPPKITGAFERILIQEPINLAYLGAFLISNGFKVVIWDFEVEPFSEEILAKNIARDNISIAGITSMTPTINNAHDVAKTIKKISPKVITIAGGPHVTAIPSQTLEEFPEFDYLVLREGELPMLKLCQHILNKQPLENINGIAFLNNAHKHIINMPDEYIEDLDTLPFPDRTLLKRSSYKNMYAAGIDLPGKKPTVVFTSRGCSQNCTFCAVKKTSGPKVRFRSAKNVINELTLCKQGLGYNHITFEDTNFTLKRDRFLEICYALKRLDLTWDCQTKVSLVDEKLIEIMKDCGCLKIAYGVESGSPKILSLINKNINLNQVKKAFELTHKAKIVACAFFILGAHPQEDSDDIKMTEKLIHEIKPDVFQLGIICPYPGTEIAKIMQEEKLISEIDWKKFNFMHASQNWGTKFLSSKDLMRLQKRIYIRYIFSLFFIKSILFKMLDPNQAINTIKLCFYMLKYLIFEKRI